MIVLGSTSEVAQAFVEKALQEGEKFERIYLFTSNKETTERFARHIDVKFLQQSEIIELDLTKEINYQNFDYIKFKFVILCNRLFGRRNRGRSL